MLVVGALVGGWTLWQRLQPEPTWVGAPRADGPSVEIGSPPDEYRIVSRVDSGHPVGTGVHTEILEVRRPWQSRLTTLDGPPPGGDVTDVLAGDFGKLHLQPTDGDNTLLVVQPDLAASDLRLDIDLDALVAAGGVEVRERRSVDGRPCQVYRTDAPPQGQVIGKLPSKSGDVVESCVDEHGIILEQLQFFNDTLLLRRRVVEIDVHPNFERNELEIDAEPTVPLELGGGALRTVADDDAVISQGTAFFLDHAPAGFRHQGRYAVAPSSGGSTSGGGQANRRSSFVDVWTDGVDVLLLDQGGLAFGGDALGPNPLASKVELGRLGTGRAIPGARLSQVALTLDDGRYVRLLGTLPVDRLATIMRTLRRVDH